MNHAFKELGQDEASQTILGRTDSTFRQRKTRKTGAAVVAVRRDGATHVFDTINHMFLTSSMVVPGSVYWNLGVGCLKDEVREDEEAIRNMNHLGQTIAWLGKGMAVAAESSPFPKLVVELHCVVDNMPETSENKELQVALDDVHYL